MSRLPSASLIRIDSPDSFLSAVNHAAALLRQGQLVALPTETVYGLAANALNAAAVQSVFHVKGRPSHNPVIVHVASIAMAKSCAALWNHHADLLARAFWPGPLTLILPRAPHIPDIVAAGGPTVALRLPSHPFIRAVIEACGFPLAAPSANPANTVSPTSAQHVLKSLGSSIPLIIDAGHATVGIESTVIDVSGPVPQLLRPGMILSAALSAVVGPVLPPAPSNPNLPPRSPGQLPRHYAPQAKVAVRSWDGDASFLDHAHALGAPLDRIHAIVHTRIPAVSELGRISVIPRDPEAYARAIYSELHACDDAGAAAILIEAVPAEPAWQGIADRLARASGGTD